MNIPRSEFPNPQWERKSWQCLNGEWDFDFDRSNSALEKEIFKTPELLTKKITVPFCPESELSGINQKDFIPAVMYAKRISITPEQLSGRVILHFGAVDYHASVYVNAIKAAEHKGGYTPFEADITDMLTPGENTIFLHAEDDTRSRLQPSGKQCDRFRSVGCHYTRTTGIWQSVWLEFVPEARLLCAEYRTDVKCGTVTITGKTLGEGMVCAEALLDGSTVGTAEGYSCGNFSFTLKLSELKLWKPGEGNLYSLKLTMGEDTVYSYFGMRELVLKKSGLEINGEKCYQRLVLDQGFYPDGIYTAPTEEAMINDIKISLGLGFNGARLHQKVFEPRFLYHCDRLGYIVWGEYPDWGFELSHHDAINIFTSEWAEAVERDINHPAIVCWCPLNETQEPEKYYKNHFQSFVYSFTKHLDPTRPCIDASGYYHAKTDIFDLHDYVQSAEKLIEYYADTKPNTIITDFICRSNHFPGTQFYSGEPLFLSEYGGAMWNPNGDNSSWGYSNPETEEEFIERYRSLTEAVFKMPSFIGFCYTQLYDVEQEQNGLYTYDRKPKFDPEIFKKINSQK